MEHTETAVETLIRELEEVGVEKLFNALSPEWEEIKKHALLQEKIQQIRIGDKVECVLECALDKYYGFPRKNCWNLGDTFVVKKIEILPYGTFIHDGKGHNMDVKRAKLCKKI